MAEYHYPWLKVQKDTRNDPKIRKLSLAEQAVFYNLLQYAGEQEEEGAFDDGDREELALEVAADQQDVLDAALTQLLRYKVIARLDDGRLAFVNYEKHQATKADIAAARQRRFYEEHKHEEPRRSYPAVRGSILAALIARDGGWCPQCGSSEDLTVDHIQPLSKGGTNDLENLRILCRPCNSRKGARV